jgi:hypothetical protein
MKSICIKAILPFALVLAARCTRAGPTTAASDMAPPSGPTRVRPANEGVVPAGQLFDVRLQHGLSSETAAVDDPVTATTTVDLRRGPTVLVPAGSMLNGYVSSVDPAEILDRTGSVGLRFNELSVHDRTYSIRAIPTRVFRSRGVLDEGRSVGIGLAVGAMVGGAVGALAGSVVGGLAGGVVGAAVGAVGVIAATRGSDVVLPAGTTIRIRLELPIDLAVRNVTPRPRNAVRPG